LPLSASDRALKLLERRPHFRRELENKLSRAGYEAGEIAAACERLAKAGYLDDAANARAHAATLATRRHLGAARIRQELARRGADREAIDAALAGAGGAEAELERAREAAVRWSRSPRGGPDALARHLARKGFDRRVIFSVLKELAPTDGDPEGEAFAEE
jgi:regulatory protein